MIKKQELKINEKADEPKAVEVTVQPHSTFDRAKRKNRRKRRVVKLIIAMIIMLFLMPIFTHYANEQWKVLKEKIEGTTCLCLDYNY